MPEAEGIQANLICNGSAVTEYPTSSASPCTVWCESTPGHTFEVQVNGPKATTDCSVQLYCDGVHMKSYAILRRTSLTTTFHGIYLPDDYTKLLPFKFADLGLCEEDDSHPEQIVKNLGTVSLKLFHCKYSEMKLNYKSSIPSVASNNKFSERNKKASMIPHTISLGESITAPKPQSSTYYTVLEIDDQPFLQFVWQYRSRSMLITAGVIPRPPSPTPDIRAPTPPSPAHQNDEPRALQAQESRVTEHGTSLDVGGSSHMTPGPSAKTQLDSKPDMKPRISGIETVVIDLCDENTTSGFFSSSIDNPILLDDDDDPPIQSSENIAQAPSSSTQQVDIKPVKIELETQTIPASDVNQTKRAQDETAVEEQDQKRVKVEMVSDSLKA